jgi:hypothetical protein
MTNPTSNFGWQMPTSTDLVTDLPADFEVFGQAVDTDFVDLLGGTTGQVLSKTTNTDLDFTWVTPQVGDITAVNVTSPITGGGSAGAVTIGINAATTSVVGAVQLSDSTSTTSSVLASTPTATKSAYDLANTANTAAGAAQTTANDAIAKSTVTTAGDIIYRNATVPVRLGIGTAGQILQVNSGATAPEWTTPAATGFVGASAFRTNSNLAVNSGVATAVTMTSESFDTNAFHDNSTNTSRMTIPSGKAGKYLLVGSISFDTVAVNSEIRWYKNGAAIGVGYLVGIVNRNVGGVYGNGASLIVDATVGDYYEMFAHQTNTNVNLNYAVFSIVYLGA